MILQVVGVFIFLMLYGIPMVVLLVWHGRIIHALRRQAKTLAANVAERRETGEEK